jgi:hypothetical protein
MAPELSATQVHIEGLLHLGALAIAVTAAYVGLDRIKVENDEFSRGLARIREQVATYIGQHFDIRADRQQIAVVKRSLRMRAVIVLAHIGHVKVKVHWWTKPIHFVLTNLRVPFYRYFSGRRDIKVMSIFCLICLATFLYLVGLQVFDFDLTDGTQLAIAGHSINLVRTLFILYTAIIVFAFVSVMLSSGLKLANLARKCSRLYDEATRQRDAVGTALMKEAMEFNPKPPPPDALTPDQAPPGPAGTPPNIFS